MKMECTAHKQQRYTYWFFKVFLEYTVIYAKQWDLVFGTYYDKVQVQKLNWLLFWLLLLLMFWLLRLWRRFWHTYMQIYASKCKMTTIRQYQLQQHHCQPTRRRPYLTTACAVLPCMTSKQVCTYACHTSVVIT